MTISKSSIVADVCRQQNANMQSHMRGYGHYGNNFKENIEMDELKSAFHWFLFYFCDFMYKKDFVCDNGKKFSEVLGASTLKYVAKYLEIANEELLNNTNFTNEQQIKFLGNDLVSFSFNKNYWNINNGNDGTSDVRMDYIVGVTNDEPNIIRIGITEKHDFPGGYEVVNGTIDICSNGEIITHDFDKTIFKNKWKDKDILSPLIDENGKIVYDVQKLQANLKDSGFNFEALNEISDTFMYIFELSDLKTKKSNIHR